MAWSIVDILLGTQHLLSVGESAESLGTCTESFHRWRRAGQLTMFKVGNQWKIDPAALVVFIQARQIV
jgi:hypothetical protein